MSVSELLEGKAITFFFWGEEMPTIRSYYSFQQFWEALQYFAHKQALNAVKNIRGRPDTVRIVIHGARYSSVEIDHGYTIKFYASHASVAKNLGLWKDEWGFDVEDKNYMTSNHKSKISFWAPDGDEEKRKKAIMAFIEQLMSSQKITPRFSLAKHSS